MISGNIKNIAILGSTGHIAKNLIVGLSKIEGFRLHLFSRSSSKTQEFLLQNKINNCSVHDYLDFKGKLRYHIVINCVGIGNPQDLVLNPFNIFEITEKYDNMIIGYLMNNQETIYINLSSGAAYGPDFHEPATENKKMTLQLNELTPGDYYGLSKSYMEGKHRSLSHLKIIDLRIFGFFSPFIDTKAKFLINDIIGCLEEKTTFVTSDENIIRDYIHPNDFLELIKLCMVEGNKNDVFDVYSLNPVSKFEIIEFFVQNYNLTVKINPQENRASITGSKYNYYSNYKKASEIGYYPKYSSMQSISDGYKQIRMRNI